MLSELRTKIASSCSSRKTEFVINNACSPKLRKIYAQSKLYNISYLSLLTLYFDHFIFAGDMPLLLGGLTDNDDDEMLIIT